MNSMNDEITRLKNMGTEHSHLKSYIPHRILIIDRPVEYSKYIKILERSFHLAFDWANRMGQQGKRVFDFFLDEPEFNGFSPSNNQVFLRCKIECTIEERKEWEKNQKAK